MFSNRTFCYLYIQMTSLFTPKADLGCFTVVYDQKLINYRLWKLIFYFYSPLWNWHLISFQVRWVKSNNKIGFVELIRFGDINDFLKTFEWHNSLCHDKFLIYYALKFFRIVKFVTIKKISWSNRQLNALPLRLRKVIS